MSFSYFFSANFDYKSKLTSCPIEMKEEYTGSIPSCSVKATSPSWATSTHANSPVAQPITSSLVSPFLTSLTSTPNLQPTTFEYSYLEIPTTHRHYPLYLRLPLEMYARRAAVRSPRIGRVLASVCASSRLPSALHSDPWITAYHDL